VRCPCGHASGALRRAPEQRARHAAAPGRFLLTGDARYAKLRPFLASAVTWFRNPFALLFVARARPRRPLLPRPAAAPPRVRRAAASGGTAAQVTGEDADEYRRGVRGRLRELVERAAEAQPGGAPEWLVLYVCPLAAGPASKAAGKVRPAPLPARATPRAPHGRCSLDRQLLGYKLVGPPLA
jgi:hypothetical protein